MKPTETKTPISEKIEVIVEVSTIVLGTVMSAIQLFKIFRPAKQMPNMPI